MRKTSLKKLRILFVAMVNSIHTARWVNQLSGSGWEIHLFPSMDLDIHPDLENVTIHDYSSTHGFFVSKEGCDSKLKLPGTRQLPFRRGTTRLNQVCRFLRKQGILPPIRERAERLVDVVQRVKPRIIHSLEMQHAGYLTLQARRLYRGNFPPWIFTPWGSDINFFGRLQEHKERIKGVLAACDYYCPESERDKRLGREFGFSGKMLPVLPGNGGLDLETIKKFRETGNTSNRRLLLLKGYQGWAGRALFALKAIEIVASSLIDYTLVIYAAGEDVQMAAELLSHSTGIRTQIIPYRSHEAILKLHGQARISLGISITDGVANSMLEAMAMGSFPIESNTSCADEWIKDGENGFIVPPEDPWAIAEAIRKAASDDGLVNRAAKINSRIVQERLDKSIIQPRAIAIYQDIFAQHKTQYK